MWPAVKASHQIASRHYAFEGTRLRVLAVWQHHARGRLSARARTWKPDLGQNEPAALLLMDGGSAIIAPDGEYLVPPVYDEETIIVADLDLSVIAQEQMTLDVTGGYSRDDIFTFAINRQRLE